MLTATASFFCILIVSFPVFLSALPRSLAAPKAEAGAHSIANCALTCCYSPSYADS